MVWQPQTNFEDEVVNLQSNHDFIFGNLNEIQHQPPRPQTHIDYAAAIRLEEKKQQKRFEATGSRNNELRTIQNIQRITGSKPLGEQPSLDDWDSAENLEKDTIGLIRYCGLGPSIEQPLTEKVTISSYPVENTNKIVQNGRRKVALFFDNKVFKLKDKVSDTSSGFESCNSASNEIGDNKDNSNAFEFDDDTSFNTSSSFSLNTSQEFYDSFSSGTAASGFKSTSKKFSEKPFTQYDKLIEETSLLSLNKSGTSKGSRSENSDSFRTADDFSNWKPVFGDEDVLGKKDNWPTLSKNKKICDSNTSKNNEIFNKTGSDITDDSTSEASNAKPKKENFLERFIKSEKSDKDLDNTSDITPTESHQEPITYASITKKPKTPKKKEKTSTDFVAQFPPFYTTRKMYSLKRSGK